MEFPGGSITNIRVIDGFSNVYWRIYTEDTSSTNPASDGPNNGHTVLKHISRLKELELRLRSQGSLVLSYPRRLGLLIFSATPDFEHLSPTLLSEGGDEPNRLLVGSSILKVWTSGSVSSGDLAKSHRSDFQTANANSPALSQRPQGSSVQPRRVDNSGGSAAIYASFISAVTAAFSLQIVRQNNAIPLGPRTVFNTVESDLNEGQGAINDGPTSVPVLTTLQVQLTSVGKLTVAFQTVVQTGLTRLNQPGENSLEDAPGTDLWLAPTGSIARLAAAHPAVNNNNKLSFSTSENARQWKQNVLEWLGYFGLPIDVVAGEGWVEVEVWEPFYSKLSGEAARVKQEGSSLPLKRILWPSAYCFRRTKSTQLEAPEKTEESPPFFCDPLDFAEDWYTKEIPKAAETDLELPSQGQERQVNNQDTLSPGFSSLPEGIESLSRASLYPEMQTASLVYPTPPDGTAVIGVNPTLSSDVFAEDLDHGPSLLQNQTKLKQSIRSTSKSGVDPDVTMEFGPAAGLGVGSGLYDTNEDDDLFGDMNERDFGTKGITDADFSFFDDDGFDHPGKGSNIDHSQESPDFADLGRPNAVVELSEPVAPSPNSVPIDAKDVTEESHEQTQDPPRDQPSPESNAVVPSPHFGQVQTISPPLSPVEVKKILFPDPSSSNQLVAKGTHVPSHYSPVAFKNNASSWDKKYGADGKFSFMGTGATFTQDPYTSSDGIPTIGLPRRKSNVKALTHPKAPDGDELSPNEIESSSSPDSSSETDESDNGGLENNIPPATLATLKRKRARSSPGNSPITSSDKGLIGLQGISTHKSEDSVFLGNFLSTFSDWSIAGFFSLSENQVLPSLAPQGAQVQIAQLLVDQITQSSLNHKLDGEFGVSCLDNQAFSLRELLGASEYLGGFDKLDLNAFVSLQEQNSFSPDASSGLTPRQNSQRKEPGKGSITRLPLPHLRVRRGKSFLETLPPAISFWETFDLEPANGPKDITAYCIHPHFMTRAADAFLERLGLLYTSCNLGSHSRGDCSNGFNNGLAEWVVNPSKGTNYSPMMQQLNGICEDLGTALLESPSSKHNIIIYIINPFSHAASLVDICAVFWCLLQNYFASGDKQQSKQLNEVLLQVIPMDFVTSAESLVVPPQTDYLSLAMEVYSRCSTSQIQSSLVNCAPPVMLAETLPQSIGFKLASESSPPMQEGKCLHVACSKSQDQRWMTVAWSDNSGALQRTMSYCIRFRNSTASRALPSVRSEIWAATKDIMDKSQARWRVILVNTENMDQDEHDTWLNLAEQYNKSRPVPVELTILSVNTAADLSLSPPRSTMPMSVLNPQTSSTPIATPLPSGSILSPDQVANAPTPPSGANAPANAPTPTDALFESESESLLADICDESWSVVLSHRLNGTLHLTEYRPALASGYLLRRKGPADADGAFSMNVNLLFTQRSSSSPETTLREIIGMYRDLATLARVRGTRIVQTGTLPWHIATAVRAQEVLSYVL